MIDTKISFFKVKEEHVEEFKQWGVTISSTLLKEAIHSIVEENCLVEEVRILYLEKKIYLIAIMVSEPNKHLVKGPDSELNIKHREIFRKTVEEMLPTEIVYKLSQ